MNLRRRHKHTPEVPTSSLVDIMFFLMLFFLIMSTLVSPSVIKLTLPKSTPGQTVSKQNITLSVDKDSNYFISDKPVAFDQIESTLAAKTGGQPDATVILRADNTLPVQKIVDLISIANKLKLKMVLATQKEG